MLFYILYKYLFIYLFFQFHKKDLNLVFHKVLSECLREIVLDLCLEHGCKNFVWGDVSEWKYVAHVCLRFLSFMGRGSDGTECYSVYRNVIELEVRKPGF